MTTLNHFSTTKATSLSSGMTAVATAVYLVDGSTYPDPAIPGNGQYSIIIGYGSDREEVCTVIAKPGTNQLTVTRGQDSTAAVSKNIGDVVVHGVSARDFNEVATRTYVDAAVAAAMPPGVVLPYGSASVPSGWLLCNGQATTGYPILTAMYGATVPDLRDKFILGDGGSLPNTGGAATVQLQTTHMPSHSHGGSTGNETGEHTHGVSLNTGNQSANHTHGTNYYGSLFITTYNPPLGGGAYAVTSPNGETPASGVSADHYHSVSGNTGGRSASHNHSVTAEGSGTAHENMPPYYALTFMVRAG